MPPRLHCVMSHPNLHLLTCSHPPSSTISSSPPGHSRCSCILTQLTHRLPASLILHQFGSATWATSREKEVASACGRSLREPPSPLLEIALARFVTFDQVATISFVCLGGWPADVWERHPRRSHGWVPSFPADGLGSRVGPVGGGERRSS